MIGTPVSCCQGDDGIARAAFTPLCDGCQAGFPEFTPAAEAARKCFYSTWPEVSAVGELCTGIPMCMRVESKFFAVDAFVVVLECLCIGSCNDGVVVERGIRVIVVEIFKDLF